MLATHNYVHNQQTFNKGIQAVWEVIYEENKQQ